MDRGKRIATIGLALIGAALLALAVQGGRWWTIDDITIGPVSSHRCFAGDCRVVGLGWVGGTTGWARAGQATYAAGLCAAALLVFSAAGAASRRVIRILARSGLVAAVTAAVSGAVFAGLFPGVAGSELGRGAWFYLAGVIIAVVAQVMVLRLPVPAPATPAPATPAPASPAS